jgi:hypothetical protein
MFDSWCSLTGVYTLYICTIKLPRPVGHMGRNPNKWRDSALGRGESAHTSYQVYNKGLGLLAFDRTGSTAYLLRGPMALLLLLLHGARVRYTILRT